MVIKDAKEEKEWLEKGQYVSHLTPAQQNNVIKLVGNRCLVKCLVEDVPVEALWDTGAQVSIASHEWVMKNFLDVKINPIEDLLENNLDLKAANGLSIPYKGFIEHDVLIPQGKTVSVTCRANTRSNAASKLPVLFESDPEQPWPTCLEIEETLTNINSGFSSRVVIQARNSTDHDILLPKRTILGRLQLVKSVTPVEVREKCDKEAQVNGVSVNDDKLNTNTPKTFYGDWIPEVDLNGLTEKQKLVAQQMLLEESDCFSRDDEDIGCSEELKMKINLTDNIPVQKNYNSIPKPLYPEVKQYIEDL
ncbi:Hypothetical predicted protein [Paramuricea clavata]|uniref:Uncharacterized protein n=1 Tax=Paramuricea clavata TaxID=317549 RepID=A0A7D9LEM0_PARCT|nr:Hypothetical predicted protein [Paramuricea clavata]